MTTRLHIGCIFRDSKKVCQAGPTVSQMGMGTLVRGSSEKRLILEGCDMAGLNLNPTFQKTRFYMMGLNPQNVFGKCMPENVFPDEEKRSLGTNQL